MKYLPRIGYDFFRLWLLAGVLGPALCLAQSPPAKPKHGSIDAAAIVRSVKVISDSQGAAVEIVTSSSQPLNPTVESIESPPRLVIDLPNTRFHLPDKRFAGDSAQIADVRVKQSQEAPPVTRVVVDLLHSVGYSTDDTGPRLLVRLHPMAEARQINLEPPSVTAFTKGVQPAAVAVSPGNSGVVVEAGSRLAGDSSVTAGLDTTILHLTRGGEVRVCPGTTLSVTTSQNGSDLMLGMSTGALEARYTLSSSADSVLTPDFRMLLEGPGEFHFAISADTRGNTCVRALPGNTASVVVSELMGDGTYRVKSSEQVVFHSGRLNLIDATVPENCGCPPPAIPAMRASAEPVPTVSEKDLPPVVHLAQPGDAARPAAPAEPASGMPTPGAPASQAAVTAASESASLPAPEPSAPHVQVEAPFVFRAADLPASAPNLQAGAVPMSRANLLAPVLMIAEPPEHKGVLGKMKGFFSGLFR
jgi:hypothetical protein